MFVRECLDVKEDYHTYCIYNSTITTMLTIHVMLTRLFKEGVTLKKVQITSTMTKTMVSL